MIPTFIPMTPTQRKTINKTALKKSNSFLRQKIQTSKAPITNHQRTHIHILKHKQRLIHIPNIWMEPRNLHQQQFMNQPSCKRNETTQNHYLPTTPKQIQQPKQLTPWNTILQHANKTINEPTTNQTNQGYTIYFISIINKK